MKITNLPSDVILIDTPGQSEVFIFRVEGAKFMNYLKLFSKPIGVSLIDPTLSKFSMEASIALLLSLITQMKFDIPVIPVINKADLIPIPEPHTFTLKLNELKRTLIEEGEDVLKDMLLGILDVVSMFSPSTRLIKVSAKTGMGLKELYSLIHEAFCSCGDLT